MITRRQTQLPKRTFATMSAEEFVKPESRPRKSAAMANRNASSRGLVIRREASAMPRTMANAGVNHAGKGAA